MADRRTIFLNSFDFFFFFEERSILHSSSIVFKASFEVALIVPINASRHYIVSVAITNKTLHYKLGCKYIALSLCLWSAVQILVERYKVCVKDFGIISYLISNQSSEKVLTKFLKILKLMY